MLTDNYQRVTRTIMGLVSIIFVLVFVFVFPYLNSNALKSNPTLSSILTFVATFGGLYTIVFSIVLWAYEKYLWRLFHMSLDFNGYWHMVITYDFCERHSATGQHLDTPYSFESVFKVDQNIFDLKFREGHSAPNEIWRDLSLRLKPDGFFMSYEITRSDKSPTDALPNSVYGIERVEVVERGTGQRPNKMIGSMCHGSKADIALYRGTTYYRRINKQKYNELLNQMKNGNYRTAYKGNPDV